jgi:hypothetical protein
MGAIYGSDALHRLREQQEARIAAPQCQPSLLDQAPSDAPMDAAILTVWNGERFVAYDSWLATAPLIVEGKPEDKSAIPADADCVVGDCGGVRICLDRDAQRWLMYVGARKPRNRRRDFASPFLVHAIRTAEQWCGAPGGGWRAEKERDGKAADIDAIEEWTDEERES